MFTVISLEQYQELAKQDVNATCSKSCSRLVYELLHHVTKGSLRPSQVVQCIKELNVGFKTLLEE